jgi:hypothetical protein
MADMDNQTFGSRVYLALKRRRPRKYGYGKVGLIPFFSHAKNMSQRKMKTERNPMKDQILLAALLLVGCLVVSSLVEGSEDNPPIAGMNCYLDRIAIHVSCHSSLVDTEEEAVTLFSRLVDEVQAALPSDRWRGMPKEPGTAPIRSYTYEDQRSNAHIDIAITAGTGPAGQNFYMVSFFAWPH